MEKQSLRGPTGGSLVALGEIGETDTSFRIQRGASISLCPLSLADADTIAPLRKGVEFKWTDECRMWLHVSTTNNDPEVIAGYYLKCITSIGGMSKSKTACIIQ